MSDRAEYLREYARKYRESHPEKMAEYNRTQMERRRARRVVRQGVCARCGKAFEVGIGKRMTKYCSHTCMKREMTLRQLAKARAAREAANAGEALRPRRKEATDIFRNCGLKTIARVERGVRYYVRRDKSVASPLLKTCTVCGKKFTASRCTAMTCSRECSQKHYKATHPAVKHPKAARPVVKRPKAARPKVRRDSFGLTREQRLAVISAQDGDRDALWTASQSWTPAQRKFAHERWEMLHPTRQDFYWGKY